MKHLFALPFVVVTWILSNGMLAQPTSGFVLETLDQPYEALMGATELSPLYWDDDAGWDDPEFTIPLGFDFEFSITSFSSLTQWDYGTSFYGGEAADFYTSALFFLLGEVDLADLGNVENDSLGNSPIRWLTEGMPGEQVFTLEYVNAGLFDEVYSGEPLESYSSLNFQLRLFEATGVLEVHFGPTFLTELALEELQTEDAGWHALYPGLDGLYYEGIFILTNVNTEVMYDTPDALSQNIAFEGYPSAGRLFRYTPAVVGCHLEAACNYDEAVNYPSPETCTFPDAPGLDCDGNCIEDADGDGVCDALDGCTEGLACNYNSSATEDDGSCILPEPGYDCSGQCLNDMDGDGICDVNEIPGCTDPEACNYDEAATDWEFCEYPGSFYDCDGECLMDTDGDGVCDELEQDGCTDPAACNYDFWATEDDGSCLDSLPVTLLGDTLVSVGDTIVVSAEEPVNYVGGIYPSFEYGTLDLLEVSDVMIVGVVLEGFESCQFWFLGYDVGCNSDTLMVSLNQNASAVTEFEDPFQLYPNPVSSSLTLVVPQGWTSGVDARMVNALGQTVLSQRLAPGSHAIDVSELSNGVHLLICGDRAKRILIQH